MNQKIGLGACRGGVLLPFVSYLVAAGASVSIGAGALREGVGQYIDAQKEGEHQVCVIRAAAYAQQERPELVAACTAKANARIDAAYAGVLKLIDSTRVL